MFHGINRTYNACILLVLASEEDGSVEIQASSAIGSQRDDYYLVCLPGKPIDVMQIGGGVDRRPDQLLLSSENLIVREQFSHGN